MPLDWSPRRVPIKKLCSDWSPTPVLSERRLCDRPPKAVLLRRKPNLFSYEQS